MSCLKKQPAFCFLKGLNKKRNYKQERQEEKDEADYTDTLL